MARRGMKAALFAHALGALGRGGDKGIDNVFKVKQLQQEQDKINYLLAERELERVRKQQEADAAQEKHMQDLRLRALIAGRGGTSVDPVTGQNISFPGTPANVFNAAIPGLNLPVDAQLSPSGKTHNTGYERTRAENQKRLMMNDWNKDKLVQDYQKTYDAAITAQEMVDSDNPVAREALKVFMARASGEVGNLAQAEQERFGGSQAILAKLEQAAQRMATGKLSDDNKKFIRDLAKIYERRASANYDSLARARARRNSQTTDLYTEDELYRLYNPKIGIGMDLGDGTTMIPEGHATQIQSQFGNRKILKITPVKR